MDSVSLFFLKTIPISTVCSKIIPYSVHMISTDTVRICCAFGIPEIMHAIVAWKAYCTALRLPHTEFIVIGKFLISLTAFFQRQLPKFFQC